jgi:predicted regulator of Ras-like GTPase activity (Roadblock/LC7/MglB family)
MFSDILREIVDGTAGGVGAVLMGYDGIAVEEYFKPCQGVDLHLIAVEYANVLKEIKKTADILQTGAMEEVSVKTERFQVVIGTITEEYFVALTLEQGGNFGKARYLLKREAPRLKEALA